MEYSFFLILFIYLFWLLWVFAAACSPSLVAVSRGYSVVFGGLLTVVASLVAEYGLWGMRT